MNSLAPTIDHSFAAASSFRTFFNEKEVGALTDEFAPREQPILGVPDESCTTNLFFGFFFDGTKNSYENAEIGKNHSNVARLYDCYPGLSVPGVLPKATDWQYNAKKYTHFFKVYVPGVSTKFTQVGDSGEGIQETAGGASGALAERRIIWALVQGINNVHRYFLKVPLIQQPELDSLLRRIVLNRSSRALMAGKRDPSYQGNSETLHTARREFERILRRLHAALKHHMPDKHTGKPAKIDPGIVKKIYVSTFGFSRGATQARAFVNWFLSLCKLDAQIMGKPDGMSLAGFDVEFDFLGLFDTVASIGVGNTFGNGVGKLFDGHGAWTDAEDSLRIPPGVKCLHLVAAHEIRRSFPVDSISVKGYLPEGCQEIVVPGAHSDVGCGYCPREQGRGTDPNGDDMLARIPLLMMYKAARLSGAPLKLEWAIPIAQARFALKPETIAAFNAYIATCKETKGPIHVIMREQARKYIEWRLARRINGKDSLRQSRSFRRAAVMDQNDLDSAAQEFEEEIDAFVRWRNQKGKGFTPAVQEAGFDNEHLAEWEEIARWWKEDPSPDKAVMDFFDDYVHDSRAWFKPLGDNPEDEAAAHAQLASWVKLRKAAIAAPSPNLPVHPFVWRYQPVRDMLNDEQRRAADEYAKTGKIPRMKNSGREPFAAARAGYLRFRKIYSGSDSVIISSVLSPANAERMVGIASDDNDNAAVG